MDKKLPLWVYTPHTHTAVSFTRKILQKDGEAAREYLAEGEMLSLGLETGLLLEALWSWA